jgi:ribose/xylose/arabinose/galactoside ABC-type transport system permease subunit
MNTNIVELIITYGVTAAGMLAGLLVQRADTRAYWRWPVYSAMAMALGVVLWNLLRKHVLPHDWPLTHSRTMYFCALVLYALVGLALGLLLGRLTGRTKRESQSGETG